MDTLLERLKRLSKPNSSEFIPELRKIIFDDSCTYPSEEYKKIINDESIDEFVRFSAFYCLFSEYRRFEKKYDLMDLVDQYMSYFKAKKQLSYYIHIIWSQYYKIRFLVYSERDEFDKALENANKAINDYKNNRVQDIGCYNNYADIVLDSVKEKGIIDTHCLETAMKYVDTAIVIREKDRKLPPYANYYCSKARLYLYRGEYHKANENIKLAIAYERTDRSDSAIRLSNYHNVQLEIKTKELMSTLESQVVNVETEYTKVHTQLEQQQVKYIEILGFFSAIIAIIIGAISITLSVDSFQVAGALILLMSGGILVAYTILKELFSENVKVSKLVLSISLSVILILIGLLLGKGLI